MNSNKKEKKENVKAEYTIGLLFKIACSNFNSVDIKTGMRNLLRTDSSNKNYNLKDQKYQRRFSKEKFKDKLPKSMRPDIVLTKKSDAKEVTLIADVKNFSKTQLDNESYDRMKNYSLFYGADKHIFICTKKSQWKKDLIPKIKKNSFYTFSFLDESKNIRTSLLSDNKNISDDINQNYLIEDLFTKDNLEAATKLISFFLISNIILVHPIIEEEMKVKEIFKNTYKSQGKTEKNAKIKIKELKPNPSSSPKLKPSKGNVKKKAREKVKNEKESNNAKLEI